MEDQKIQRGRRNGLTYLIAVIVIMGGLGIQWLLLSGGNPWSFLTIFHHGDASAVQGIVVPRPHINRPGFQSGMVFPRWGANAYSANDKNWFIGLQEIQEQTSAHWLQMTVNLYQPSVTSTQVMATGATPSPASIAAGIRIAHLHHYHVFVIPLLSVVGADKWAGGIRYHSRQQMQDWFDNYWRAYRPYVIAAAQAGAEQLSIGTEFEWLQHAPDALWNQLIKRTHGLFPGKLTYDMNWTYQVNALPAWMRNPLLGAIGVSAYYPLVSTPKRLPFSAVPALWRKNVGYYLDAIAVHLHKPLLISEIGYRNTADALYHPGQVNSKAPVDDMQQASAFSAALMNSVADKHIVGIFVWGWSVPTFQPNWKPAAQVLNYWYGALDV